MRLDYAQREMIMKRFGVDKLWSYSRLSTYLEHPWEYMLAYLKKVPRGTNIYSYWGTISHDLIQDYYEGKYPYERMSELLDEKIIEWKTGDSGLKFMSQNVEDGYIKNLQDYFANTEITPYEITNEKAICVSIKDEKRDKTNVFIGYIDSEYTDEDGIFNIVDYKTSSKSGFTGAKLKGHSEQLKLYAIGINQFRGIPFDKIRLRFDMMKYYEVWYEQKNGKMAKSKQERRNWVKGMQAKMRKELAAVDFDPIEVDEAIAEATENNNMYNLPKEVQDKFELHNCFIDVTITEEEAEELKQKFNDSIAECELKEQGDWEVEFPEPQIIGTEDQFYYENLASHLLQYAEKYQSQVALFKTTEEAPADEDLMALFK